jgi:vacuolar-type H+-ATPase subunit I/STV1
MKTYKAKSSDYNSVDTKYLIEYITSYNKEISELLRDNSSTLNTDRAKLKSIAAELETVVKQLKAERGIY